MVESDLPSRIQRRAAAAGLVVADALAVRLSEYVALLARWNRRINLTALAVDPPSDDAIDRLILEPVAAARYVRPTDRLAMDIGSGGGSPAIPLKLTVPALQMVLVESKVRKCAFLREVARALSLAGVDVENRRLAEVVMREDLRGAVDLVTIRAVRADAELWALLATLVKPGGRVLWFGATGGEASEGPALFRLAGEECLVGVVGGRLGVLERV